jgi:hypothetical protein
MEFPSPKTRMQEPGQSDNKDRGRGKSHPKPESTEERGSAKGPDAHRDDRQQAPSSPLSVTAREP